MDQELGQYASYLANQKRQAQATIKAYLREIQVFHDFIARVGPDRELWSEVTLEDARAYRQELLVRGKSETTINHAFTSLRLLYDFLIIRGVAADNPFRRVDHFETQRQLLVVLTTDDAARLVGAPMREYQVLIETLDGHKPRCYGKLPFLRDQLILELLYYSGMKVTELVCLRDPCLDSEAMTVTIRRTCSESMARMLQLPECVMLTFERYLGLRNGRWPASGHEKAPILLRNLSGKSLSVRSVRRIIAHYAQKAGLPPGITPETFRATFAMDNVRRGANSRTFQYLLGLGDLSTADSWIMRLKTVLSLPPQ